jgi:hypothetical protein
MHRCTIEGDAAPTKTGQVVCIDNYPNPRVPVDGEDEEGYSFEIKEGALEH